MINEDERRTVAEFEFRPLTKDNANQLQEGDYIYKHSKSGYPLKEDFDAGDYYYVTGNENGKISVRPMGKKEDEKGREEQKRFVKEGISYNEFDNNWWRDGILPWAKKLVNN